MKKILVKDIKNPLIALLAVNVVNFIQPLPVVVQMISSAMILTYIGCILSVPIQTATYQQIQNRQKESRNKRQEDTFASKCCQIIIYPLTATISLLLLYMLIKHFQEMTKQLFLNIVFLLASTYYLHKTLYIYAKSFVEYFSEAVNIKSQISSFIHCLMLKIIFPILCLIPALLEIITKHWFIDNLFGIGLTIFAIKEANIKSFKIAIPVLWLLFIYDLYWVYQSDVMVTVAKNIDLPLKLKFPFFDQTKQSMKFSMLGLGDIVLPGLLISLCIKYDIDSCILGDRKPKKVQDFTYPLFYSMLFAYGVSLTVTYLALHYFNHPQPALVFIVPICTFALASFSYFSKDYDLWKYDSKKLTRKNNQQELKDEQTQTVI